MGINDYCSKCHNIPRGLINKVSKELYHRINGQAAEILELITTEQWIEVTDDEQSDEELDEDQKMDRKLEHSQTINEWEELSEDEDVDISNAMKKEQNIKILEDKNL